MNPHISAAGAGLIAALIGISGALHFFPPKVEVRSAVTQKVIRGAWSTLAQDRVDALTAALGKIEKRPVTIICSNPILCADLQLDLDNAFESAHWTTSFDTLVFGDAVGITVSDEDLAKAIGDVLPVKLDTTYRDHLERLAKMYNQTPERKAQIIIGRNVEK